MAWVRTHTRNSVSESGQVIQFKGYPTIHQEYYGYNKQGNPKVINHNDHKGDYYDAPLFKAPIAAYPRTETHAMAMAMEFRKLPMRRDFVRADEVHHPWHDYGAPGKEYQGRPETSEGGEGRGRYGAASPPGGAYAEDEYAGLTIDCVAAAIKYNGVLYTDDKKRRYPYPAPSAYDSVGTS